jgi:hypothetical protein
VNLRPSRSGSSIRPFQRGRITGRSRGAVVSEDVEWLVDTGSDITVVRNRVGSVFETTSRGLTASPTTGGQSIQVVTGLAAEFEVEDLRRRRRWVQAGGYVGIKPNDAASDLLGMQQVADVEATVTWSPSRRRGSISHRRP